MKELVVFFIIDPNQVNHPRGLKGLSLNSFCRKKVVKTHLRHAYVELTLGEKNEDTQKTF